MKCPKCGGKLYINQYQYHCNGCDRYYDVCYFHDRAEKAEGELKAIKARIEAVTEAEAFKIVDLVVKNCVRDNTVMSYREHISKAVVNLIKQIGGEK